MLINPVTLTLFSRALNKYIALDPQADMSLLAGNVLCLDLTDTGKKLFFIFDKDLVSVEMSYDGKPDATIFASPVDLAKLFASKETKLLDDNVRMEGKVRFAGDVQKLFSSLDVDWEEQLSRLTGDVFAHHAGKAFGSVKSLAKDITKNLSLNTSEYLKEEARVLAVPERVERFCESVDDIVMHVDRLSVRIEKLKKKCNE